MLRCGENKFSFRFVQLADIAEIWVRLMAGPSCAGEGRYLSVETLLHRTRSLYAFSYSKLIEVVTFFCLYFGSACLECRPRLDCLYRQSVAVFLSHIRQMQGLP